MGRKTPEEAPETKVQQWGQVASWGQVSVSEAREQSEYFLPSGSPVPESAGLARAGNAREPNTHQVSHCGLKGHRMPVTSGRVRGGWALT